MPVFKTNDNVEIYYEVKGQGRPLFLLPGWTCTTKFWKYNIDELAKTCKVIAMDMRGHGESESDAQPQNFPLCHGCKKSAGSSGSRRRDRTGMVHGCVHTLELY